jgi:uncharacterized protein
MMYIENNEAFEWNAEKAVRNFVKHGITFKEALTAFDDPHAYEMSDPLHSQHEIRLWLIGEMIDHRIVVVVFTIRGKRRRLISARIASYKERVEYGQNKTI